MFIHFLLNVFFLGFLLFSLIFASVAICVLLHARLFCSYSGNLPAVFIISHLLQRSYRMPILIWDRGQNRPYNPIFMLSYIHSLSSGHHASDVGNRLADPWNEIRLHSYTLLQRSGRIAGYNYVTVY